MSIATRILFVFQEGHHIDPATVAGINPYGTDHLILREQYHLDDARQPPLLHYDLAIQPPLEAAWLMAVS